MRNSISCKPITYATRQKLLTVFHKWETESHKVDHGFVVQTVELGLKPMTFWFCSRCCSITLSVLRSSSCSGNFCSLNYIKNHPMSSFLQAHSPLFKNIYHLIWNQVNLLMLFVCYRVAVLTQLRCKTPLSIRLSEVGKFLSKGSLTLYDHTMHILSLLL